MFFGFFSCLGFLLGFLGEVVVLGVFLVGLERILSQMRSCLSQVGLFFVTTVERTGNNDLRLWQHRFK